MAYIRHSEGAVMVGFTDTGHTVPMDSMKAVGGNESAPSPMELVLQAIMGCTAMDVVSILKKMRVEYDSFEVHEEHERSEQHPKVYTRIHMTYKFEGEDIDPEKVKKAVRLSMERYCPVAAMMKESVEPTWEITINGGEV